MLELEELISDKIYAITPNNKDFKRLLSEDEFFNDRMYDASELKKGKTIGYILMGVGIALTLTAIITKAIDIATYSQIKEEHYHSNFKTIPMMIVDKKDIVTTVENEDGELQNKIDFDQYVYYEAVKCNRQDVGMLDVWQNDVENYQKAGCGDAADLNADYAREWLALYTVKSPRKGAPILADSLNLTYGSGKPRTDKPSLHLIGYSTPIDVAEKGYCYGNKKGAIYFSWQKDK